MKHYSFQSKAPFEFELKNLSDYKRIKRLTGVPHRAEFYQIIRIESGESVQTVDFSPISIVGSQLLFVAKNQVVSFDVASLYSGENILFTDKFFIRGDYDARFIRHLHLFNPFTGNVSVQMNEKMTSLWKMTHHDYTSEYDSFQSNLIHCYLSAFLIHAERQYDMASVQVKKPEYQLALQFTELVEQHHKSLRKVGDYVDVMNKCPKLLSRSLQAIIGKTPKQYIDDRILLEAKRLLVYSDDSIKEITFSLGFDEPTNFSKFFREQTGLSPTEFKKQHTA
jgi:AraC-like DNA-binding protein